jgi:hypothetical protein
MKKATSKDVALQAEAKATSTFMFVGELGGDCPLHGRRGVAWGPVRRHACGCVMLKGEKQVTADDVRAAIRELTIYGKTTPAPGRSRRRFKVSDLRSDD